MCSGNVCCQDSILLKEWKVAFYSFLLKASGIAEKKIDSWDRFSMYLLGGQNPEAMVFHLLSFIYFVDNQTEQNYYLTVGKRDGATLWKLWTVSF